MGPLKPDVTELIVAVVCFALVFVIVGRVLLPRIARVLEERHDLTEGRLDEADGIKEEIAGVAQELQRELGEGRREAARVRQELVEEGAEAIASLRAEGQRVREELVASNHRAIAEERAIAEAALHAELGLIATELAGKVVGESLGDFVTSGDTVERFLADVQAHAEENAAS
ncbi:hypothetical protein LO772_05640 [Yinghuangia sp. ASG 101]|uniref:F0F1 ATP synthase subunit B family protein n=1 Tax=Yinghuangia sp. ASG 101 TaxID=2896848 RepID=UPI001E426C67|nr:hypothetical protein [Yinghuangia sp. ASG 101]UGQ13100.1 hypothetical protein LO772_05640 [Yinghuangia sp. ASG 101]